MADNNNTGKQRINRNLVDSAGGLAGPAVDLATGQGIPRTLGNMALDKLVGPTVVLSSVLVGVLKTVKAIVQQSGILEKGLKSIASTQQIEGKFETILRSATLAKARIQELYQFAANSPFNFQSVAEANRILQLLTKGSLSGADGMKLIGDAAASTDEDIANVATSFGRLYRALSTGRGLDRVLFQLRGQGVVTDELADKLERLTESGASFTETWDAVVRSLKAHEGGMQNEMKNLSALENRLNTVSDVMAKAFGKPFVDTQAKTIETMIRATETVTPVVAKLGSDLAPVLTLLRNVKNEAALTVLSSKGLGDALMAGIDVAKVGAMTVAVSAVANVLARVGTTSKNVAGFVKGAVGGAKESLFAQSLAGGNMRVSRDKWEAAKTAASDGSVTIAASLVAEAAAARVSAAALAVHAGGLASVGQATGVLATRNYILGASSVAAAGGVNLLRRALGLVTNMVFGSVAALWSNPFTAIASAVGLAVGSVLLYRQKLVEAQKELSDFNAQLDETNRALNDQARAVKSVDDWRQALQSVNQEIAKTIVQLGDLRTKSNEVTVGGQFRKLFPGITSFFGIPDTDTIKTRAAGASLEAQKAVRQRLLRMNSLAAGEEGINEYRRLTQLQRQLSDEAFGQAMDLADEQRALDLINQRVDALTKERDIAKQITDQRTQWVQSNAAKQAERDARITDMRAEVQARLAAGGFGSETDLNNQKANASGVTGMELLNLTRTWNDVQNINASIAAIQKQNSDDRLNSVSEMVRLTEQIARAEEDITTGRSSDRSKLDDMYRRRVDLEEMARRNNDGSVDREIQALKASQTKRSQAIATQSIAIRNDAEVINARMRGKKGLVEERAKAKEIAAQEVLDARMSGNSVEEAAARNRLNAIYADEASERKDVVITRAANKKAAAGDRRGARAVEDAANLSDMIERYLAMGLSEQTARNDFGLALQAEAMKNLASPVADSMQSIGGGGGFAASNPIAAAQERAAMAADEMVRLLTDIRSSLGNTP